MMQECGSIGDGIQEHHNETRMSLLWSSKARKTIATRITLLQT